LLFIYNLDNNMRILCFQGYRIELAIGLSVEMGEVGGKK
jgi:hypothetical protein